MTGKDGRQILEEVKAAPEGPQSGRSSAETTTVDFPNAVGAAWGASKQESTSLSARYSPTATNSASGGLVTGFVQGLTNQQQKENRSSVESAMKDDPILASILAEIAWLLEHADYGPEYQGRIDALRVQYQAARTSIVAALAESGVTERLDFGSLTHLVVVGFANTYAGHTERKPTKAEVENLARSLSNPISAARGENVVLGKGEQLEKNKQEDGEDEEAPEEEPEPDEPIE